MSTGTGTQGSGGMKISPFYGIQFSSVVVFLLASSHFTVRTEIHPRINLIWAKNEKNKCRDPVGGVLAERNRVNINNQMHANKLTRVMQWCGDQADV